MGISVKTILGFVIVLNAITVSFFFFASNKPSQLMTLPDTGLNKIEHKWSRKPLNKFRPESKTAQSGNFTRKDDIPQIQQDDPYPQDDSGFQLSDSFDLNDLKVDNFDSIDKQSSTNQANNSDQQLKDTQGSKDNQEPKENKIPITDKVKNSIQETKDDPFTSSKQEINGSKPDQGPKDNKGPTTDKVPTADQGPKANQEPKVANEAPKTADPVPKTAHQGPKASDQVSSSGKQEPKADQVKSKKQRPKDYDYDDDDTDDSFGFDKDVFIELGKNAKDLGTQLKLHHNYSSAVNPFRLLGFYKEIPLKYFELGKKGKTSYEIPHSGLKKNPAYCDYSDLFNYFNPSNVFSQMYFFTEHSRNTSLLRPEVIDKIGVDVNPQVTLSMEGFFKELYDLDIRTTMFFMKKVDFHFYQEIGKQFLFNVPIASIRALFSQPHTVFEVSKYCFKRFLKTTLDVTECKLFFDEINDESYLTKKKDTPLIYLLKAGEAHRASGVFLFDEDQEKSIRNEYENGLKCGQNDQMRLIQKYIQNPLLLDRHNKFDFRMYMLIASVDPLIVYYHDGFLRVSFQTYDPNSKDRDVHLTNTHLSKKIIAETMNETLRAELAEYQMWTLLQLQDYLLRIGKITDKDWLDNHLRPQFQRAYIHLARMSKHAFWKHSSVYEMSGLDFMLDNDLRLWLLEANASPQLVGTNPAKTKLMREMLTGMFEIEYAYLRSKSKRLFAIVDKYYRDLRANKTYDLELAKKEFAEAMKNKLEDEFQIPEENSWIKVLDETIPGKGAYLGIISDDCII